MSYKPVIISIVFFWAFSNCSKLLLKYRIQAEHRALVELLQVLDSNIFQISHKYFDEVFKFKHNLSSLLDPRSSSVFHPIFVGLTFLHKFEFLALISTVLHRKEKFLILLQSNNCILFCVLSIIQSCQVRVIYIYPLVNVIIGSTEQCWSQRWLFLAYLMQTAHLVISHWQWF